MNRILSGRIRLLAVCCHLSGLSSIATLYLLLFLEPKFNPASGIVSFVVPSFLALVFPPLLTWRFTRKIHDFVDRSGKKVLNYNLSIFLYSICLIFVLALSCLATLLFGVLGIIFTLSPDVSKITDEFDFFSSISLRLLWVVSNHQYLSLIYAANVSIAVFFTLRGNVFSYPLSIPFFKTSRT